METESTACWQKIDRLVNPAYCHYHYCDYIVKLRIILDYKIHVLTSNEEA